MRTHPPPDKLTHHSPKQGRRKKPETRPRDLIFLRIVWDSKRKRFFNESNAAASNAAQVPPLPCFRTLLETLATISAQSRDFRKPAKLGRRILALIRLKFFIFSFKAGFSMNPAPRRRESPIALPWYTLGRHRAALKKNTSIFSKAYFFTSSDRPIPSLIFGYDRNPPLEFRR